MAAGSARSLFRGSFYNPFARVNSQATIGRPRTAALRQSPIERPVGPCRFGRGRRESENEQRGNRWFQRSTAKREKRGERMAKDTDDQRLAVFIDFENLALGVKQAKFEKFRLDLVLDRLVETGKLIFLRAYADWTRYRTEKHNFHESNIELIDIPKKRISGKNSADIRMVVDALDLCYTRDHINTFALLTGDSDFTPLVSKLSEYDKYVIGLGVKNSTADLLVNICDEFIYYDDIIRDAKKPIRARVKGMKAKEGKIFDLLLDAIDALMRNNHDVIWGSMVKQQIKRKDPSFTERSYGFRSFSTALESARKAGLIGLQRDQRSGSYIITESDADSGNNRSARAE